MESVFSLNGRCSLYQRKSGWWFHDCEILITIVHESKDSAASSNSVILPRSSCYPSCKLATANTHHRTTPTTPTTTTPHYANLHFWAYHSQRSMYDPYLVPWTTAIARINYSPYLPIASFRERRTMSNNNTRIPAIEAPPGHTAFENRNTLWVWHLVTSQVCIVFVIAAIITRTYARWFVRRIWVLEDCEFADLESRWIMMLTIVDMSCVIMVDHPYPIFLEVNNNRYPM